MVTNRRWAFFLAFSVSVLLTGVITQIALSEIQVIIVFLIGLFVDILLYQVSAAKTFYQKVLWSLAGGGILLITLPTISYYYFYSINGVVATLFSLIFWIYLLATSYIGAEVASVLKKIFPNLFQELESS